MSHTYVPPTAPPEMVLEVPTRERLAEVFDAVKNKEHWKLPIDTTVPSTFATSYEICEAINYFCGGLAEVWLEGDDWRVYHEGYYHYIGS